jgi:hypothetical protein
VHSWRDTAWERANPATGSTFGLAAILAVTIYVIVDLEYPRVAFFQIADFDQLLVEVRASMH